MMKALSKPLSSPNRADKFPPPLMRFLRSNAGSRSRGRSRSSPMFYLRSKKRIPIETTQEPSSPKVTCIGQVRVRRSAKSKSKKATSTASVNRRRCWWFEKPLFCGKITPNKKPFTRVFSFCKCGLFSRRKKVDVTEEDCFRVYSKNENIGFAGESDYSRNNIGDLGQETTRRDFQEPCSSSPPKNALLLTRCRSAPYRSSSLGGRFWGSPLSEENKENEEKTEELEEPRCEKLEEENNTNNNKIEELKKIIIGGGGGGGAVHPLLLTRCKSEPARTGERLLSSSRT